MKGFLLFFFLLIVSTVLKAEEVNSQDWLLWYKKNTHLPFSSALTIYPPVTLYADENELKGSMALPYSLDSENPAPDDEFLIVVTDANGKTHFIKPQLKSVGFVNDIGMSISMLHADSFQNGKVLIQLFKANTAVNRQALQQIENNNERKQKGIAKTLEQFTLPKPVLNETWPLKASTLEGKSFDDVVTSSPNTIVQLYSQDCGFCRKAIPFNNMLHAHKNISVLGMAGNEQLDEFNKHLKVNNIQYPFIAYEGKYAESALLKALGQPGFPIYFVLDSNKKVNAIHVGTPSLERWISTLSN